MRTELECIPCIMQQAYNTARRATGDPEVARRILEEAARHVQHLNFDAVPADNSNFVYRTAAALTGITDPYAPEKRFYNERLMALLPGLRQMVEDSTDPLQTAVRLAIAGNSIDLGIGYEFNLEEELRAAIKSLLGADDYPQLRKLVEGRALDILYLGDNAGEIVLDRLLIERLIPRHRVTYVVKRGPVINDSTREDAVFAGIAGLVPVIDTGSNGIGIKWDEVSDEFVAHYDRADLVISKGQGNFETMCHRDKDTFFLLRAKCRTVSAMLGVRYREAVCRRGPIPVFQEGVSAGSVTR